METWSLPPNVNLMKASDWYFCSDKLWSTGKRSCLRVSPSCVFSLPPPAALRCVYTTSERGEKEKWAPQQIPRSKVHRRPGGSCDSFLKSWEHIVGKVALRTHSWTLIPPGSPWHPYPGQGWSWISYWICPRKVPAPWCRTGGIEVAFSHSSHSFCHALAFPWGVDAPFKCVQPYSWGKSPSQHPWAPM